MLLWYYYDITMWFVVLPYPYRLLELLVRLVPLSLPVWCLSSIAISAISAKSANFENRTFRIFRSLRTIFLCSFFLYFPCSTLWISLDSVYFVSHRFIVPTLTPRTPACFTASCLVEQSFESVDEIRSLWEAFFIVPLQRIKSSQLCEPQTSLHYKKRCARQLTHPFISRIDLLAYGSITTSNTLPDSTNFFKVACTVSAVIASTAAL